MAKTGKFTCSACDRTFSMAAHLARHQSTMHAPKGKTKSAKKQVPKGAAGRLAGRAMRAAPRYGQAAGSVAGVIGSLRSYRDELGDQRAQVDAQLAAVDGALSALGVTAAAARTPTGRGTTGRRQGSLKDFIVRVLQGRVRPLRVMDITAGVRKAGYTTKNRTLDKSVGNALAAMPQVVKVARGQYRLRG